MPPDRQPHNGSPLPRRNRSTAHLKRPDPDGATLDPRSLVGRFFHADLERQWQGVVVAEPARGLYLVEAFDWILGGPVHQALVRIEDMMEWHLLRHGRLDDHEL